jgi:hypothetical protein
LHDVTGSYVSGFSALIAFALTGAIAIALLPRGNALVNESVAVAGPA